jgi:membrane carboxypeptidase/penicillin-binding protein
MRAVIMLGKAGGGSTITQQLAKQLWSPRANNIFERALQKPIEWVIATKLERLYSKEEILTMYLNQFDFLYNAVGIKSAAQVYFSTTPSELKMEEAAMLVGMCKNPSLYNPRRRPENALNRRNTVLNQMYKYDYIPALIMHAFSWTFMIMLPIAFALEFNNGWWVIAYIINMAIHAFVDDLKANRYKINLVVDQSIHIAQIIITWLLFVTK